MAEIVVVTGSARPNSVNSKITSYVIDQLSGKGADVVVADVAEMQLPYFDTVTPPSDDTYEVPYESVQAWSEMVTEADGVVFVAPEYNHSLTAIQKNAIDWLYAEWNEKPVAFVGYGWYAAENSYAHFLDVSKVVKMNVGTTMTGLTFMKEINLDGSFADETAVAEAVNATLAELLEKTA